MIGAKKFALNLNVYRNAHHMVLNKAKIIFKNQLLAEYPELKKIKSDRVEIGYLIERCDNKKFDTMNIVSVVDKFFLDALVEFGCIPDDNYNYVRYKVIQTSAYPEKMPDKKIHIFCTFF